MKNFQFPTCNSKNPPEVLGFDKRAQTEGRHELHSCGGHIKWLCSSVCLYVCMSFCNCAITTEGVFEKFDAERF